MQADSPRARRELETVRVMIALFCRAHHKAHGGLCPECNELFLYASERIARCPYGSDKPTCQKCPIHCYKRDRREQIREVMRFAGPKMALRHPLLALWHLISGRRKPPLRKKLGQ